MDRFRNTRQPDWDWWARLWPTPGATLRRLGVSPGDRLAEVGCGNGYFALPAARITDPAPVYALDIDEALLAELERLATRQGIENVVPVPGDARSLARELPDPVDTVLLANTFHGIDDAAGFLAEVWEALAPDGTFVVVNWRDLPRDTTTVAGEKRGPPSELRLSPDATEAIISDAVAASGVRRVDLPPYHYALVVDR